MFPNFPEFIPLTLELKEPYDQLAKDLPPYSDIAFATLQIWWNLSERLAVSILNGNLVIDYNLEFDPDNSGLGLVGKHDVDRSIEAMFAYLREKGRPKRLMHVPEFVVEAIADRERLEITEEPDYHEYLLDSAALSKLEGGDYQRLRTHINRFLRDAGSDKIELRELNLSLANVQDYLFESISEWEDANATGNDPDRTEHDALRKTTSHSAALGIRNLAVYMDKRLHGVAIYHQPHGKNVFVLHHLKANYGHRYISDFMHNELAKLAVENGISTLNIEMDLGLESLRHHKQGMRPAGMLRKFTIRPKQ